MKRFIGLLLLIIIGTVGWRVGETLSSDAVAMAVGILLDVMAGIPTVLMVLAADRREQQYRPPRTTGPSRVEHHYHVHLHPPTAPNTIAESSSQPSVPQRQLVQ